VGLKGAQRNRNLYLSRGIRRAFKEFCISDDMVSYDPKLKQTDHT
jgi:hypothetical protein